MIDLPERYKCPVSLDWMRNPVKAPDDYYYDKSSLQEWLKLLQRVNSEGKCPLKSDVLLTNSDLEKVDLELRKEIRLFMKSNRVKPPKKRDPLPKNFRFVLKQNVPMVCQACSYNITFESTDKTTTCHMCKAEQPVVWPKEQCRKCKKMFGLGCISPAGNCRDCVK